MQLILYKAFSCNHFTIKHASKKTIMITIRLITYVTVISILITLSSCKMPESSEKKSIDNALISESETSLVKQVDNSTTKKDNKLTKTEIQQVDSSTLANLISSITTRQIPYYDSTNFDNIVEKSGLSDELFFTLGLKRIIPYDMDYLDKIWIRDKLNLSENFYCIVFGFYPNEHELFTTLITFDKDYKLIDFKHIAYDEIAEGCMRTESKVDITNIIVFNTDFCYKETTDTIKYLINDNGQIIASH